MSESKSVKNMLELTLEAEMTVRSITTRLQQIRELQAEIDDHKRMLSEQMMDNYHAEKRGEPLSREKVKREEMLSTVISSLEYIMLTKHADSASKIESEIEDLKHCVSKIPSKVERSITFAR
jgi:septal ring factor EnvC (AmiA/AmiB activator)